MKIIIAIILSLVYSQEECDNNRYLNEIFDVNVQYEIEYGENVNQNLLGSSYNQTLYMDVYTPVGDSFDRRPLVFFMFGGSFISGSKSSGDIVALCTKYAKRGYVAVAIDYRLSPALIFSANEETAYKAVMKAMHDVKAAIRYFKMMDDISYETYLIDVNRVFVGGVSAGAIAAVNAGYLSEEYEIPSFLIDDVSAAGGLEGNSGNPGYDSNFHGIINLCGAVGDNQWIVENDIPIVSMHGDQDDVVPYDDNLVTLFGLNIQIDGSYIIHQRMLELENYTALHTHENQGHVPFGDLSFEAEYSTNFLYDIVCSSTNDFVGDLNEDSTLNILDIVLLVDIILNSSSPTNNELFLSDMNEDGALNIQDIILLINVILQN